MNSMNNLALLHEGDMGLGKVLTRLWSVGASFGVRDSEGYLHIVDEYLDLSLGQ